MDTQIRNLIVEIKRLSSGSFPSHSRALATNLPASIRVKLALAQFTDRLMTLPSPPSPHAPCVPCLVRSRPRLWYGLRYLRRALQGDHRFDAGARCHSRLRSKARRRHVFRRHVDARHLGWYVRLRRCGYLEIYYEHASKR